MSKTPYLGSISPGDNACSVNYGGCGTLCLAIPGGRVCACADNQVLEKNNVTCSGRRTQCIRQGERPKIMLSQYTVILASSYGTKTK